MRRRSSPPPGRALPAVRNAGPVVASAMDTIRNLAWIGNAAGRREMDLPYTCRVPRTYPQVGGTGGGAARTTGAGAAAMPVPYGHRRSHDVAGQTAGQGFGTPYAMGSRSLNQAVPPIGAAGRCGRVDESVGMEFPQRLGHPVAAEAAAGILRGTSRSGRSSPPSRSPQYRRGMYPHRGAPRLIGASSACPPRAAGIWWNPVLRVGVHGGSHRGESQP